MSKGITSTQKPRVKSIRGAYSKAKSTGKLSRRVQREVYEKVGKIRMDLGRLLNVRALFLT